METKLSRYAVIGHPVGHSRSPEIHQAFALATGRTLRYTKIEGSLTHFEDEVRAFFDGGGLGMNVTLPFKERAFALARYPTERARKAKAANTLGIDQRGGLWADNTDGIGLVRDIEDNIGLSLADSNVLMLGAGGAARGVVAPLLEAGVARLSLVNRTLSRAENLVQDMAEGSSIPPLMAYSWAHLPSLGNFDVVINATSSALSDESLDLPWELFSPQGLAYDLSYAKTLTPFLKLAQACGASRLADGFGMLVEQAAASFERWQGVRPATQPILTMLRH